MRTLPRNTILVGDAAEQLATLPTSKVDCVVTSPPYFQQRDYGVTGQLGLEATVKEWVRALRPVFGEVARVLKPTGSLWLNVGDTYSPSERRGAPAKSLLLAPERLLLALGRNGWIVRNKVVWAKTNPMPSGVQDRLETTYDNVFFLVRSRRYFFDLDAARDRRQRAGAITLGRNPGDVWRMTGANFSGPHFATFGSKLVERPILTTCPAKICVACGAPWKTETSIRRVGEVVRFKRDPYVRRHPVRYDVIRQDPRLVVCCGHSAPTRPGVVLDPFFGTGTVGAVAQALGRDWLGIELNPEYVSLAEGRLGRSGATPPMRGAA